MNTAQYSRAIHALTLAAVTTLTLPTAALAADGRDVYMRSCSTCHGPTGRADPSSPVVEALGVVPADFTDPLFNSREPASDWQMVIKHGGAALGLAEQMPAHEDALSDAEVDAVVDYVKSLADTSAYPPGEMNLMLPIRTKKAFPEDEVVYRGRWSDDDGPNGYKNVLEFEKRVGKRGQVVVELVQEGAGSNSELAEVEFGYKQAFAADTRRVVSGAAVIAVPVEAEGDGELQTYIAYGRELSPLFTLQSSLRLKFPFEDAGDGEAELAGIIHFTHTPWPRNVFPALELTATRPFDSDNGDTQFTILPQVRIGLTRGGHVALNLGMEYPLSDQAWDKRFHVTLLWDFADGGFFKGW